MNAVSLKVALTSALLAGLLGALLVSAFHTVATEPLIDRAIALEEQHLNEATDSHDMPVVSRDTQRLGLWLGFLFYGLSWALPFGIAYYFAQGRLPGGGASRQALALAGLAYWSVALMPALKFPANPPGVGDPDTIGFRQSLYFGFLAISIGGAVLALMVNQSISRVVSGARRGALVAAFLVVFGVVVYFAMPGNPDPVLVPAEIVSNFRLLSLAGLTLFWAVMGVGFALLLRRQARLSPP